MLNKLRKKMRQRGVAMIEYAILLSFVAVVAVGFISSDGMVKPINNIVTKITKILSGETGPGITHAGMQAKMKDIWEQFLTDYAKVGETYPNGYLALSNGDQTQMDNCDGFLELMGVNDITDITGNDVYPKVWSVNTKGAGGYHHKQTDSINWKDSADSKYFMSYDKKSNTFAVYFDQNNLMKETTNEVVIGVSYEEAVSAYGKSQGLGYDAAKAACNPK